MPNGTSRAEVTLNSEKIKHIALAVIELRLSEGINQLLSQKILLNKLFLKFRSNLLKAFRVNLKACLGLVLIASSLSGKTEAGFWLMLFRGLCLLLCGPYYTVLSYCIFINSVLIMG